MGATKKAAAANATTHINFAHAPIDQVILVT